MMKRRTLLSATGRGIHAAALPRARPAPAEDRVRLHGRDRLRLGVRGGRRGLLQEAQPRGRAQVHPAQLHHSRGAAVRLRCRSAAPTPSVFLQAVDGGLDLVLVAGGGLTSKTLTSYGPGGARGQRHQERAGLRGQEDRRAGPGRVPALDLPRLAQGKRRRPPQGQLHRGRLPAACRPAARRLGRCRGVDRSVHEPHHRERRGLRGLVLLRPSCPTTTRPSCMRPSANGWRRTRARHAPSANRWSRPRPSCSSRGTMRRCAPRSASTPSCRPRCSRRSRSRRRARW